jgi:CTP:molybdopterin cytidylyltransferase MocA
VVWWAVTHALQAGFDVTWVVAGALELAGVVPDEAEILANPRWADGQATSLGVALDEARRRRLDAVVVGLGDQPGVPPESWRRVARSSAVVAVATYDGKRRNPVKLSAQAWDLIPREGDEGARSLIRERPDLVADVPCQGQPADIDTREDLEAWS